MAADNYVAPAPVAAPQGAQASVPVQAIMGEYKPPQVIASDGKPSQSEITSAAMKMARSIPREATEADIAAVVSGTAPVAATAETPAKPETPSSEAETPKPVPVKPAEGEPAAPKDSPTARIAQLTRSNREAREREAAAVQQAEAARAETLAAKKQGETLAAIQAAFKADPLAAFQLLGEDWKDIVDRVANGGIPPTEEQKAATKREADAKAIADRIAAIEADRVAEKTEAQQRQEAEQTASARTYVATTLIVADKHPNLMGIAEDAAAEALAQVDAALKQAFKAGQRTSENPVDINESLKLTNAALDGLQAFYADIHTKTAAPKAAEQTPTAVVPATPKADQIIEVAKSKQRGPDSITNAVAGYQPPAAQPRRMTPDDARVEAMRLARALPQ